MNKIVWFRYDFRIGDNKAFKDAVISGNVLPIFIYDEEIWKLQIINMNGEKIDVKPSKSSIDISFLSKGIYILNFNNNFIKFVKN